VVSVVIVLYVVCIGLFILKNLERGYICIPTPGQRRGWGCPYKEAKQINRDSNIKIINVCSPCMLHLYITKKTL
jgi:hypothetical protein